MRRAAEPPQTPMDVHFDHAGFIVEDLEAISGFMDGLGFTQTVRADHTRTNPRGERESAGSAQRCIMLRHGYIELMQITDPSKGHQLASAPSVRHGLHLLGLGTADAVGCHDACVRNGVEVSEVLYWSRPVREEGLEGVAQFAYFGSAWQPADPSYVFWVEHRTPQLLRAPALVTHRNSAAGITGLLYQGPEKQARAWGAQLRNAGLRPDKDDVDGISLSLADLRVRVRFYPAAARVLPVALEMEFDDCSALQRRCEAQGVAYTALTGGGLDLDLVAQTGLHWLCSTVATKSGTS